MPIPEIRISDYTYELPSGRIAAYPAERRDASKLLIYNKGKISEDIFSAIPDYIGPESCMVFNNTKVVPARLIFRKDTGAFIEIFCLEPFDPEEYNLSFSSVGTCCWKCIVGNLKRWKSGKINLYVPMWAEKEFGEIGLEAEIVSMDKGQIVVRFTWSGQWRFSEVLDKCGRIPIPPYINREAEDIDIERYQTLYAKYRGSVAAPTAGLHFTDNVLSALKMKGIDMENICLHVGAGTFMPVKSEKIGGHPMHSEPFSVSLELLEHLQEFSGRKKIVAVGTTSVRTLESLYYLGVKCLEAGPGNWGVEEVGQWDPYADKKWPGLSESIGALVEYLHINRLDRLTARTRIIIVPSYRFKFTDMLITNFHQPQSTLLLLIAALIGENWRNVYGYAMGHGFRFLSYGDSSLLIP